MLNQTNFANLFQIQNRGKTSALVVEQSSMPTCSMPNVKKEMKWRYELIFMFTHSYSAINGNNPVISLSS